jgi:hypothetical protein
MNNYVIQLLLQQYVELQQAYQQLQHFFQHQKNVGLAREMARKASRKMNWDDEEEMDFSVPLCLTDAMDCSE